MLQLRRRSNPLEHLAHQNRAGFLRPFAEGKRDEKVRVTLDAGVAPRLALAEREVIFGSAVFRFFLTVVQNSSVSYSDKPKL